MEDKVVFHSFVNDIYPTRLVVCITNNQCAINDMFSYDDYKHSDINDLPECASALTMRVIARESGEHCVMIVFRYKKKMDANTVSHESFHALNFIMEMLGI